MCLIQMITAATFLCYVTVCFVLTIPYIKLSCFLYTHVFCKHVIHSYVFSTPLIYKSITGRDPIALSKALLGALATTNATLDTDMPAPHANDPAHSPCTSPLPCSKLLPPWPNHHATPYFEADSSAAPTPTACPSLCHSRRHLDAAPESHGDLVHM
jgi:hypothetical protein